MEAFDYEHEHEHEHDQEVMGNKRLSRVSSHGDPEEAGDQTAGDRAGDLGGRALGTGAGAEGDHGQPRPA